MVLLVNNCSTWHGAVARNNECEYAVGFGEQLGNRLTECN